MKSMQTAAAAVSLALASAALGARTANAEGIVIGTGTASGTYHSIGRALCRVVNVHARDLDCEALPTAGPEFNLSNVTGGAMELGLVPSDLQHHAVEGTGPFEFFDIPFDNLRALFSVHGEAFTMVARRDAGIRSLGDLPGKRVNIGNPGSRQRAMMDAVMSAMGWTKRDFQLAEELPADQQSLALCHGRVHAMVYAVAHPDASVRKAAELCDAVVVEVTGEEIDALVSRRPFYSHMIISGDTYPGNPHDVKTFGVATTVVSSSEVSPQTVYAVVGAVFDNVKRFKKLHPALGALEPERMVRDGLSAPLHEGAARYYERKGLP